MSGALAGRVHDEFDPEFDALPAEVQDEMLAQVILLKQFGPQLGRPRVDTVNGSRHANMKELRFDAADGAWRVAFAFDLARRPFFWYAAINLAVASDSSTGR